MKRRLVLAAIFAAASFPASALALPALPPLVPSAHMKPLGASSAARPADHNPIVIEDAAGDSGAAADIARVVVANTAAGEILIGLAFANRPALQPNDVVTIFIDADRDPASGTPDVPGADHMIMIGGGGVDLGRWDGTRFAPVEAPTLDAEPVQNGILVAIGRADLAQTAGFHLIAVAFVTDAEDADVAGPGSYALSFPHIDSVSARFAPAAPRAGRVFRLSRIVIHLESEEEVAPTSYSCRATLAGKPLRGTGRGRCTWKLPKRAKGKRLVITIAATVGGETTRFHPYVFRVR